MPAVATPPPAATPTPVAQPVAAPVTMPTPAPETTVPDPEHFFSELDDTPKPVDPPAKVEPSPTSKPDPKAGKEKHDPSKAPKPEVKTEPTAKPDGERFNTPKELRQAYDRTNAELKSKNQEVIRLLQQLETAKAQPQTQPAEISALSERLAKRDQEFQALESELKTLRYESSPEFKSKFLEPYEAAKRKAFALVETLVVTDKEKVDPASGEPTQRRATVNDFVEIATLPEGQAWRRARQLFGEDAQLVMRHYERLNEIATESQTEIERYRKEAGEREKTQTAQQSQERMAQESMRRKADEGWTKRNKWFGEIEGDTEGNELLKKGLARVKADTGAMNPVQRVIFESWKDHAAASVPRLVHKLSAYEGRIADLEAKLKEFDASTPGPGDTTPGAPKTPTDLEEFHKFMQG